MHSMGSGATMARRSRQKVRASRRRGAILVEVAIGTLSARRLVSDMFGSYWLMILLAIPGSFRTPPGRQGSLGREAGGFPVELGSQHYSARGNRSENALRSEEHTSE